MALKLHRSSSKPDWEQIAPTSHTAIQKAAALTNGIVTPGNIVSAIGLGLVVYGLALLLRGDMWIGLICIAVGRGLDIVDGLVADATQTKSPLGEIVDAAFDKIGTLLTVIVLFVATVAPWWVLSALLLPQLVIPLVIFYNRQKAITVHPTRSGKLSMALTWVGIVGLLVIKAVDVPSAFILVTYGLVGVSLVLGMYALWQYATGRD